MKEKKILLLRHGETDWNAQMRFQGRLDVPLNGKGQLQAAAVSERVKQWGPESVWVSPQKRALETAGIVTGHSIEYFHVTPDLCEVGFGVWEGKSVQDFEKEKNSLYQEWKKIPFSVIPDKGEQVGEVMGRAARVLEILAESESKRCLVVAHGGILRAIVAQAMGIRFEAAWKMKFSNCSLSGLEFSSGKYTVSFLNDIVHHRLNKNQCKEILPISF